MHQLPPRVRDSESSGENPKPKQVPKRKSKAKAKKKDTDPDHVPLFDPKDDEEPDDGGERGEWDSLDEEADTMAPLKRPATAKKRPSALKKRARKEDWVF